MTTPAYMSVTGTKQGFNHEVMIPRDPQSGQPTGSRIHLFAG